MSNGTAPDKATQPLPRRGEDSAGRIPTQYGPDNPLGTPPAGGPPDGAPGDAASAAPNATGPATAPPNAAPPSGPRVKPSAAPPTEPHYRVRPGAPNLPIPEPQQVSPKAAKEPLPTYSVRPGTPEDPARAVFSAMADKKVAEDRRHRRRWLGIGVAALLCLVAVGVALLVGGSGGTTPVASPTTAPTVETPSTPVQQTPSDIPSAPVTPTPPPVNPEAVLAAASTDTAPLGVATLFPGKSVTLDSHSYTQALTTTSDCAKAATPSLAAVLAKNACLQVFRATYSRGTTAVTVGVAVFDTAAEAASVKQEATVGNLEPLSAAPLPAFCHATACRLTVDAYGRYAYFTVAGYTTGKPVPATDTLALAAGTDMGQMVFENLSTRARAETVAQSQAQSQSPGQG